MTVIERFLKYVSFDTQSDENSGATPSTPKQMVFAQYLRSELEQLGFQEISLDENGYLFATWPANTDKPVPTIGFIAHMDTSPDMTGAGVTPRIVYGYDGTDIVLCEEDNIILSPKQFPELLDHKGEDLIVTNGKTLLGADDKAGIAEIISAMVYLKEHPEIKHGKIRVGFNPDEEIGLGAHPGVKMSGCHGFCEMGPLVRIEPYNYLYLKVKLEDCEEIFEKTILRGEPVERLMYHDDHKVYETQEEIPFYAEQTRLVLKNCGHIDAEIEWRDGGCETIGGRIQGFV